MYKLMVLSLATLALSLTACGGDSNSSGVYHTVHETTIENGNVYNCPSASAKNECTTDTTCSEQKCELIKEVVPIDPQPQIPSTLCKTVNGQIMVENDKSCQFINQSDNTLVSAICKNSKEVILDGKIKGYDYDKRSFITGTNVQAYRFICS